MRKCIYRISVGGNNITSKVAPRLIRMTVSDKEGLSSDTADIELDDTDGVLVLPRDGVRIEIAFGWADEGDPPVRFRGTVDEPKSSGSRGGGRTITISAKGIDTKSKQKEEQSQHWDDKNLGDVMKEAGKNAGVSDVKISSDLAKIKRDFWIQNGESFIAFGQRLAEEVGGTFKIQGGKAVMTARGSGANASGAALPTISAAWGSNLIAWEISPTVGRPRYQDVVVRWYDKKAAKWKEKKASVRGDDTPVTKTKRTAAADEDEADTLGKADAGESNRNKGGGTIRIDGNGAASPEGKVILTGARAGVDGLYTISDVEHEISRNGWETNLTVKAPDGEAGKDSRGK